MKKFNYEDMFLNEKLLMIITFLSAICGLVSLIMLTLFDKLDILLLFEESIKIIIALIILWAFSKFHWDVMKGLIGGLMFSLLYQESFLVLGKLWGQTSDFDSYLIMGVQGSLYLAAQSMSFLMTIIIILNHFIIDYSHIGNLGNVIFNQISIIFKILLYIFLMVINGFLKQPIPLQIGYGFGYLSDLCIVIMIICIETQLNNFKMLKQELMKAKKDKEGQI